MDVAREAINRSFTVTVGRSRKDMNWRPTVMGWKSFVARLLDTRRTEETFAEYMAMSKDEKGAVKDVGAFVGASFSGSRKKGNVTKRTLLTLDADYPDRGFLDRVKALGMASVVYSTHSHCAESPRYRLVMLVDRDMDVIEHEAVARRVADGLGLGCFDGTTFENNRLMYFPSSSCDGEFVGFEVEGEVLCVDEVLSEYENYTDCRTWARSEKDPVIRADAVRQGNPLEKRGVVGAFCRTYDIHGAIAEFLSGVYEQESDDTYTFVRGSSHGGLKVYDGGMFCYSHHDTDPAKGRLLNAFDLVRVHLYGNEVGDTPMNRTPSYLSMVALARGDAEVRRLIAEEERAEVVADFAERGLPAWRSQLALGRGDVMRATINNFELILRNDPLLEGLAFNEHNGMIMVVKDVEWRKGGGVFTDADLSCLRAYVEREYENMNNNKFYDALIKVTQERSFHPIKKYLAGLPKWDGVERIERLAIEYLGAPDNAYVRAAVRKTFIGAVRRVMWAGCKFEYVLVFAGAQGVGKSTLFSKMAMDWFSDDLSLADMKDKTGAEKIQHNWITEISELAGMKKAELECVRGFISRRVDKFRPAYGRFVQEIHRQGILVGSTNNTDTGYLRDTTGNRRFLPIPISGVSEKKSWNMTQDEVDMLWAECVEYESRGESLVMPAEVEEVAEEYRQEAMEVDPRQALVEKFINTPLPSDWHKKDMDERRSYFRGGFAKQDGNTPRDRVCALEVWNECFGFDPVKIRRVDAVEINGMLSKLVGWVKYDKSIKFSEYGVQKGYKKVDIDFLS